MAEPLRVLVVEDEMLLLMQLEAYLESLGHEVVASALSWREAVEVSAGLEADIALVDIHLADGPTGTDVGRYLAEELGMTVVLMTANPKRIPDDFSGAVGVIAKPYTKEGLYAALNYLVGVVRDPPPKTRLPRSLVLAPRFAERWCPTEARA